jgi:heme-degrading monooxygenase HmoA
MVVEVSQFHLVPGANDEEFIRAAEESQTGFLQQQPGFIGRDLLQGDEGSWMDIVRFQDADAAQAAFQAFAGHPSAKQFEQMLDPSTISVSHWGLARSW